MVDGLLHERGCQKMNPAKGRSRHSVVVRAMPCHAPHAVKTENFFSFAVSVVRFAVQLQLKSNFGPVAAGKSPSASPMLVVVRRQSPS